jgi:hypothetical protein
MSETERTHYEASRRYNYSGVDRYKGNRCERMILLTSVMKGKEIAAHLNNAYQRGREEMMEELAWLLDQPGGQFYINQMLLAASGKIHSAVQITKWITERVDVGTPELSPTWGDGTTDLEVIAQRQKAYDDAQMANEMDEYEPSLGCCAEHFEKSGQEATQKAIRERMEHDENAYLDWDRGD